MGKRRRIFETSGPTLRTHATLLEHLIAMYPTLATEAGEKQLATAMRTLHEGLTVNRSNFVGHTYLDDPDIRFAYDTYMLSVQSPKLPPILDAIAPLLVDKDRPLRVLDIGCGTGTASIATALWMDAADRTVEFTCVDHSKRALSQSQRHLDALHLGKHTFHYTQSHQLHRSIATLGSFDVVLMMNVVNELAPTVFPAIESSLGNVLTNEGLLVMIEPSAKEPSRRTIAFRDHLVQEQWSVILPCPQSRTCPMTPKASDWCHDTWHFERPEFVTRVDHRLGLRREILKATWFVLTPPNSRASLIRSPVVVGERIEEKGRAVLHICDGDQLVELELQKKDLSAHNEAFHTAARYHRIDFNETVQKGPRLRLSPRSEVAVSALGATSL